MELDERSTPYLVKLCAFARAHGFKVTATTNGRHNPGSMHFLGRAIDVSVHGKSDDAITAFRHRALECGFRCLDERRRLPGEAVWSGPHLHLEDRDRL